MWKFVCVNLKVRTCSSVDWLKLYSSTPSVCLPEEKNTEGNKDKLVGISFSEQNLEFDIFLKVLLKKIENNIFRTKQNKA